MQDKNEDLSKLRAVGSDGTVVNTGSRGGIIHRLELHLGRPLQWNICLLHANELPLRHLFQHLDGVTSGPKTYSGEIGKLLVDCELSELAEYDPIPIDLPDVTNIEDLSTDQKYLLKIMIAVSSGICDEDLLKTKPGIMSHSRWLTTANRILRLYVSSNDPSETLKTLATFIMKVYGPMWFAIKKMSSCFDGPKHLVDTIRKSRYLDDNLKKVVDPVIQRNGFYSHPENLLLSMLGDDNKVQREIAYRRIMKIRDADSSDGVRKFVVPDINMEANHYASLIYWHKENCVVTEPPLTKDISSERLKSVIDENNIREIVPELPCHTQCDGRKQHKRNCTGITLPHTVCRKVRQACDKCFSKCYRL
uniref:Uncharacterized protein n=2 Tax=Cacopsylla melanoneura TaxID=428564 RepID=A0A8D9A187_9HEMI